MTREEAKTNLNMIRVAFGVPVTKEQRELVDETFDMAIQALSQEPTVQDKQAESEKYQKAFDDGYANGYEQARFDYEQEPCDDVVLRKSIIEILTKYNLEMSKIAEDVNALPSVTQKSGKWIKMFLTDTGDIDGQCSECGFIHKFIDGHTAQYNYCPNCSAKMESEDKE